MGKRTLLLNVTASN
jgi:CheY-like chemotaxis protein